MKQARDFTNLYNEALRDHLLQGSRPDPEVVGKIGGQARAAAVPMVTKVIAHIPVSKTTERKWRDESIENQPGK